jgi:hypothetical protein
MNQQSQKFMSIGRIFALAGVAILVLFVNFVIGVLYRFVYSYAIHPGHEPAFYQEHIPGAAPYLSVIAGIPLMYLAGWWVAGWWNRSLGVQAALIVWLASTFIDFVLVSLTGWTLRVAVFFLISFVTKLVAAYWGARNRLLSTTKLKNADSS